MNASGFHEQRVVNGLGARARSGSELLCEHALDLERVFAIAIEEGVAIEVNGLAPRLDLSGEHVRDAIRSGVRIVCSTDAHSIHGLENMELAVHTARRGWATAADVVNTGPLSAILRT